MKTNIEKLQQLYSVQLHTAEKISALFKDYLPHGYSKEVVKEAEKVGRIISDSTVRQVKTLKLVDLQILNIIIELAQKYEVDAATEKAKLEKLTLNN